MGVAVSQCSGRAECRCCGPQLLWRLLSKALTSCRAGGVPRHAGIAPAALAKCPTSKDGLRKFLGELLQGTIASRKPITVSHYHLLLLLSQSNTLPLISHCFRQHRWQQRPPTLRLPWHPTPSCRCGTATPTITQIKTLPYSFSKYLLRSLRTSQVLYNLTHHLPSTTPTQHAHQEDCCSQEG